MQAAALDWKRQGFSSVRYKAIPLIHQMVPAQDDLYALFRLKASRVRCDLASSVDLAKRLAVTERRKRGQKKALKFVTISADQDYLEPLWEILAENLDRRHSAQPVHSQPELKLLAGLFPEDIFCRVALEGVKVVAGLVFFNSPQTWHAQYIAGNDRAREIAALDALFEACICEAFAAKARYFDFGTCNEEGGWVLNENLYRFKAEFGGGGVAYETYQWDLV
ncbi:MAG: GNAT family N-acetyltransferase [Polyangia bacterium]